MVAAQSELESTRNQAANDQAQNQLKAFELQLKDRDQQLKALELQGKQENAEVQAVLDANKQLNQNLKDQISGLKDLIEAFGVQVLGGSGPAELLIKQSANISQTQDEELQ